MRFTAKTGLIVLGAALALASLIYWLSPRSSGLSRPNVILISLDTLRADRLGTYGYNRETSPFLDSFASKSAVFENTVAPAPWTLPSHVSMMSGLYPGSHMTGKPENRIPEETRLLAEILKEQGYRTLAYTGGGYVGKRFGFPRGFDEYNIDGEENTNGERSFASSLLWARDRIKENQPGKNFFMFLHTYAIHCPYQPAQPYYSMFKSSDAKKANPRRCGVDFDKKPASAAQSLYLSDRYDGSIRQVDDFLRSFFNLLEADGALNNTIVIITSDHGEEFLEHGRIGHRFSLFRELLMVPLMIYAPGIRAQRISTPVNGVDLFPTIMEMLNLDTPPVDGQSLLPLLENGDGFAGPAFQLSELERDLSLRSLLDPFGRHFILNAATGEALLFDLLKDPLEKENLATHEPQLVVEFKRNLEAALSSAHKLEAEEAVDDGKDSLKQLKALGYL